MTDATLTGEQVSKCTSCATELAPDSLSCPACKTLVYGGVLKQLAADAARFAAANEETNERDAWNRALTLLPYDSQQHATIRARVAVLNESLSRQPLAKQRGAAPVSGPWWKRWLAGGATVFLLLIGKLKFLLLGLTKLSTFVSMFAFFGVYWNLYGWPLALGLAISIYIHEMGHVAELRRVGIHAGAPFFIPGLGALILLKQHVDDPVVDARIGLAGPIYGLGAALVAFLIGAATSNHIWYAIAQLGAYINLFNLIPVWQLDGSRGFHALGRGARLMITGIAGVMFLLTAQKMLLIIGAVAAYRAFQRTNVMTHRRTLAAFAVLLVALSVLAEIGVR